MRADKGNNSVLRNVFTEGGRLPLRVVSVGSDSSVARDYSKIAAGLVRSLTITN